MPNEPTTGNSKRRHGAPPTGYSRIPIRSVSRMKATTANPVNAPITSAKTKKTWPSRCRRSATRSNGEVLHQLPLVVWAVSLISTEFPTKSIAHRIAFGRRKTIKLQGTNLEQIHQLVFRVVLRQVGKCHTPSRIHRIEREMQSFDFSPRAAFVRKIEDEPNRDLVFHPSAVELSRGSKIEHPCLACESEFPSLANLVVVFAPLCRLLEIALPLRFRLSTDCGWRYFGRDSTVVIHSSGLKSVTTD